MVVKVLRVSVILLLLSGSCHIELRIQLQLFSFHTTNIYS
jgi:hypothetical protein